MPLQTHPFPLAGRSWHSSGGPKAAHKDHTGLRHRLLAEISSEPGWRLQPSLPHTPRQGIINTSPLKKKTITRECGRETTKPARSKEKNLGLIEMRGETPRLGGILMPSLFRASKPETRQQTPGWNRLENRGTPLAGHCACFFVQGSPCCWGWPVPVVNALKSNVLALCVYHTV